jgi:hypothetical protein
MICHLPERTGLPPSFSAGRPSLLRLGAVMAHALGVGLPDRQAPLLEQVHRVVDVAAEVVGQVVARDAHQVVGDHAGVVGRVLLGADVGVDRGQALRHGAGAVHGGLVDQLDLQFLPVSALTASAQRIIS